MSDIAMPLWPKSSRLAASRPHSQGGLNMIDVNDQALAPQLVYVKRITLEPFSADFLTPWLLRFFHVNTDHASFLPTFLAPDLLWPYFKSCPPFLQLLRLIIRLPPSWSLGWVSDLPHPLVLTRSSTSDLPLTFIRNHCLISDLLCYNHSDESLGASRVFIRSSRRTLTGLLEDVFLPDLARPAEYHLQLAVRNRCRLLSPSPEVPVSSPHPAGFDAYLPNLSD